MIIVPSVVKLTHQKIWSIQLVHSGTSPETRKAEHLFVQIEQLHSFLDEWTQSGTLPKESANYLKNYFLNNELKDWDVSDHHLILVLRSLKVQAITGMYGLTLPSVILQAPRNGAKKIMRKLRIGG